MPHCPRCGSYARETVRYCSECGERVDTERDESVRRPCAFCRGTGDDPGGLGIPRNQCPVCHRREYNLTPENYVPCRHCGGTGRKESTRVFGLPGVGTVYEPCEICEGTGWCHK